MQKKSIPGQPIEVVVRHSKVTAKGRDSEDLSDDDQKVDIPGPSKIISHSDAKRKTSKLEILREGGKWGIPRSLDNEIFRAKLNAFYL